MRRVEGDVADVHVRHDVGSERLVVDRHRLDHLRLVHSVLRDEDHPDGDAALEEARALDRSVHLPAAAVALPPEATPGDRREVEVPRRVEDADVEARRAGAGADAADPPEVDGQEDRRGVLRTVLCVDQSDELDDRQLARAARLRVREATEVADVGCELVEHEFALARLPLELVGVDEVPACAPGRRTPLEDGGGVAGEVAPNECTERAVEGIPAAGNVVDRVHVG